MELFLFLLTNKWGKVTQLSDYTEREKKTIYIANIVQPVKIEIYADCLAGWRKFEMSTEKSTKSDRDRARKKGMAKK